MIKKNIDLLKKVLRKRIDWCACGTKWTEVVFKDSDSENWKIDNLKLLCDGCYVNHLKENTTKDEPVKKTGYISNAPMTKQKKEMFIHPGGKEKDKLGISNILSSELGRNVEFKQGEVEELIKDKDGNLKGIKMKED